MSVRSAVRRHRRRALFLALPVLAAALAPTAAQASWPGLNGWESFSSNRFDTAISGDIFVMPPIGLPQVQLTTARPDDAQSAVVARRQAHRLQEPPQRQQRAVRHERRRQRPDPPDELVPRQRGPAGAGRPTAPALLYRQTPDNPITQNADIWQIDVNPAAPNPRPVLERTGDERYPSYSPDGTKILFRGDQDLVDHSGDEELYVMNADGTDVVQLTHNDVFDSAPAFSPDGTKIAFESARDSGDPLALDIYVMNADGTDVRRLTADPAHDEGPIFSPDGTKIAFASLRSGQEDIWVMNADGSDLRQLTDDPARDESPDWQPVPFDMTGHIACGDVGLDRGQASSVAARERVVRHRADPGPALGRRGRRRRPARAPARVRLHDRAAHVRPRARPLREGRGGARRSASRRGVRVARPGGHASLRRRSAGRLTARRAHILRAAR